MNKVTLRFYVQSVTETASGNSAVRLQPDYKDGANSDWSRYTPSGSIELNLSQDAAIDFYRDALHAHSTIEITMEVAPAPDPAR